MTQMIEIQITAVDLLQILTVSLTDLNSAMRIATLPLFQKVIF